MTSAGPLGPSGTWRISQSDTGEQALEIAETPVRSGAIDVIVIDSMAALVPQAEIECRDVFAQRHVHELMC
jgi:RecA/RadA recombinase